MINTHISCIFVKYGTKGFSFEFLGSKDKWLQAYATNFDEVCVFSHFSNGNHSSKKKADHNFVLHSSIIAIPLNPATF